MLLTDKFVYVHLPKTGGTFVTKVVKLVLCPNSLLRAAHTMHKRYGIRLPILRYRYHELRKHAMCKHIPAEYSDKPIMSCIRNPWDLYVSHFRFGWWKNYPGRWFYDVDAVVREYGAIEQLSFDDFVRSTQSHGRWTMNARQRAVQAASLGWASVEWIHYFCKDPTRVLEAAADEDLLVERARAELYAVEFLQMSDLNTDLHDFLLNAGYRPADVEFVRSLGRITPGPATRSVGDHWHHYYSGEMKASVRQTERLLFRLFPDFESSDNETKAVAN